MVGIFDQLVDINDIQSLNSAINAPVGQMQGQPSSSLRGSFFQLPSTIAPTPTTAPTFATGQNVGPQQFPGGVAGRSDPISSPIAIDRSLASNFGLTAAGIDTAQQVLGGFGVPGVGIPGVNLGRTFSNLGALNAAEAALGQEETGLLGELLGSDILGAIAGRPSLRQRAISKGDEAARDLADASIRSGATRGTINASQKRAFGEASRARSISAASSRREQNRARDLANIQAEASLRSQSANRVSQQRADREASAARDVSAARADIAGRQRARESGASIGF